jgi:subtilisin family serine protease
VLGPDGSGSDSNVLKAIDKAVADHKRTHGPSVISMSLGGGCNGDCSRDPIVKAVENAVQQGVVVVVAAGNEACSACRESPSASHSALVVAAADSQDGMAIFSNFGQVRKLLSFCAAAAAHD